MHTTNFSDAGVSRLSLAQTKSARIIWLRPSEGTGTGFSWLVWASSYWTLIQEEDSVAQDITIRHNCTSSSHICKGSILARPKSLTLQKNTSNLRLSKAGAFSH